jgi:transcriptional regulator with XRE-family HTH domain
MADRRSRLSRLSTRPRPYPDLASWREAHGLNQTAAAAMLGISQQQYSRLERGTHSTKGALAKRIMFVTGVPLEVLAGVA